MPFVYMLAAVGVASFAHWLSSRFKDKSHATPIVSAFLVLMFIGVPAWKAFANGPHYALYTNALAAERAGYFFPHDEFYDDGLREAIAFVCRVAPTGATIAHETPAATRYYLTRFERGDLTSRAISAADFDVYNLPQPAFVIVQRGRTYFENQAKLIYIRSTFQKVHEVKINGLTAAEVFYNRK
jgi:hypothetical protein